MCELTFYHRQKKYNPAFEILQSAIQHSKKHRLTKTFDEFAIDIYTLSDAVDSRIVAIDFDNTITADVDFYLNLIDTYREQDWEPVVCTLRDKTPENLVEIRQSLRDRDIKIYSCGGHPKQETLLSRGIKVSLWIDDYFPSICPYGCKLLLQNGIDI